MRSDALLLGVGLAAGALLVAAPWLWPRSTTRRRRPRWSRLREDLVHAGIRASLGRTLSAIGLAAVLFAALALAVTGLIPLAAIALVAGSVLPLLLIRSRAEAHRNRLRAVWPDVIDSLIGALRAGLGLPDAVASLATLGPEELRTAFAEFAADYRRSASFTVALDRLKQRLADPTADRLVEIFRLARELGGSDVIALLRALGSYLREDVAATTELAARQSWISNAARLGVVAPWLVLIGLSLRPDVRAAYNSPGGAAVILIGGGVTLLAYQLMKRLARLPRERRWT